MDSWAPLETLPHFKSHFPSFMYWHTLPFICSQRIRAYQEKLPVQLKQCRGLWSSSRRGRVAEWVRTGGQSYSKFLFAPFQSNIRIRSLRMMYSLLFSCLFDTWNVYCSFVGWFSPHPCNPHTWTKQRRCMVLWDVYDKCLVIALCIMKY